MNAEPPFPNPPIVEAILDIRCNIPPATDLERLKMMHEEIKDRFPNRQDQIIWESGIQVDSAGAPDIMPPTGRTNGYQSVAVDGKKIVQARSDGFTLNKVKPYENWDVFVGEGRELWQ